jgi:metallophosphoesterase (TIGR00282 family)
VSFRLIMIGDIVGQPGRRVVQQHAKALRDTYGADLVLANAENVAGGSGITPQLYERLLKYGIDGITLGDHCYRQKDIVTNMAQYDRLVRPANLPEGAAGQRWMRVTSPDGQHSVIVITVLGRLFVNTLMADDPYACVDRMLQEIEPDVPVVVEIHGEATSEKVAMGWHLAGRAALVAGTHTHIPTADAKVLEGGTGYITDLGMSGPYDSVLGRRKERVLQFMTTAMPAPFDVASEDVRLCGVMVDIDDGGKATHCQRIEVPADLAKPPFA